MKKVGVLLSGCGVFDGTEIHESVLTLLSLDQKGVEVVCMAPNIDQYHVVDHLTQKISDEKRNVLQESARIARGDIKDLKDISEADMDALIVPGGFGAAKNLSDFAFRGKDATIDPEVKRIFSEMVRAEKPVGAMCVAPATLALALSEKKPQVTIGNNAHVAQNIEETGSVHRNCSVNDIIIDSENKIVTTPAYMLGAGIKEIYEGIDKLVDGVISLIDEKGSERN